MALERESSPWPRAREGTFAALRIVSGLFFAMHGMQKVFGWFEPKIHPAMWTQLWVGGLLETVLGILVALGLFFRCATFVASGMMAVAYFQFHQKMDFAHFHFLPPVNGGEPAALYCFLFLFMSTVGPGVFSLDAILAKRAKR